MKSIVSIFHLLNRDQRLIFAGVFLAGFGDLLWLHLQPLYLKELGAEPKQIGGALSAAGLAVIFVYIPSGMLADRWRRKPIIVGGWLTTLVGVSLLAAAPDWRWATPALALYFLSSFARPALSGYIAASGSGQNISRAFAIIFSGYSFGGVLAPAVGGWIGEQLGLRAVLWFAAAAYSLSLIVLLQLTNHPPPAKAQDMRLSRLLSDRLFLKQIAVFLFIVFALDVGAVLAPNYLQDVKGLSVQHIGQLGAAASLGMVSLTIGLAQLPTQRRTSLLLDQLAVIIALILLLIAPRGVGGEPTPLLYVAYYFRGGVQAIFSIISGRLSHWLQPDVFSLGFGFRDTVTRIALTLSPLVAGYLYAQDAARPLYFGIAALAGAMLLTLTLPRGSRQPRQADQAARSA